MNILVTGGAGFIGSHLCEKLLSLGHRVLCIDNFNDFYSPSIKRNNIKGVLTNPDFKLFEVDILNQSEINNIFSSYPIDLVIHLAARAGVRPSIAQPLLYEKVNVIGTLNILEACKYNKINKLIFASSSSVYGGSKKIPFSEEDRVDFPISPYASTKKSGELICYTYYHLYSIETICVRFFTVYGPRQRPEMAIHKFTRQIFNKEPIEVYGDGSSSRDYTYIDDIINGIVNMINKVQGYEIVNLGNSYPVKLLELIHLL
ncbi:MAG: NAD-dependent epimerase/dehydratase family protein, partial [Actinobacteria bacterium]|nr:NAD-dependent epimerase/dehydratase family protein [Actinomycetota bacterium]